MRELRAFLLRFSGLFGKETRDKDLTDEMESHIGMHIEDNERAGMSSEDARRAALLKLGGLGATKEAYRGQRGMPVLENLFQDMRFGRRGFQKNPGFTLAIGIFTLGANTALFGVINAVLRAPSLSRNRST